MLPDRFFYPVFFLLVIGTIYAAFAYGPKSDPFENPMAGDPLLGFVITGDDLQLLRSGPGLTLERIQSADEGTFMRSAAGQGPAQGVPSAGIFLSLLPDIGETWEGHTITVQFELRKPEENGSDDAQIQYYSVGVGNDTPVSCPISTNWQICTLHHVAPILDSPPNLQFIGLWPDTKGLSRFIDIRKIEIFVDQIPLRSGPSNEP